MSAKLAVWLTECLVTEEVTMARNSRAWSMLQSGLSVSSFTDRLATPIE